MNSKNKIVSLASLKKIVARTRKQGRTIAFTNGCFDILHAGHVAYLEQAKKKNRLLIVGLNSDRSISRIKGPSRPITGEKQRAAVLAGLSCVDNITVFHEDTPLNLIKAVKPDVLIKGADWKNKVVVGEDVIRPYGGRVELIKYLPNFSTTKIIEKIKHCA
jgi:D-beta-D-heptose 7-phosphate kinase/D-beta-D-heptose 1-phosphate adenosyltransferase